MGHVSNPRELFLHELRDIYAAERRIVEMLPKLISQASDDELRGGLEEHLEETRGHVRNVEDVFSLAGSEPEATECPALDGLAREHEQTIAETAQHLYDEVVVSSAAAVEHYEIATYEGLVTMAEAMHQSDAARLLEENLEQEKRMLEEGKQISKRLAHEAIEEHAEA